MPSISCRRGQTGGRPAFVPFGDNGSNTAHCSSVRSPRAMNRDHSQPKIHFRYTAWGHSLPITAPLELHRTALRQAAVLAAEAAGPAERKAHRVYAARITNRGDRALIVRCLPLTTA
ncbi:hypothetical protein ACX9I7_30310 [Streptomyces sp. L500]|uniref:hypothetical protein n=1 Tax=Streptomyces abikoensis TaxID=97398 RepID=UPI0036AFF7A8